MDDPRDKKTISAVVWVFCALSAALILVLLFQYGQQRGEAIGASEASIFLHMSSADQMAVRKCSNLEMPELSDCIQEIVQRMSGEVRAEKDLIAQTEMSLWTLGMLVVSVASLGVTSAGVWFVKRTLDATMAAVVETSAATKAMHEANQIMKEEQRAWLVVEFTPKDRLEPNPDGKGFSLGLELKVENLGGSPALNLAFAGKMSVFPQKDLVGFGPVNYSSLIKEVLDNAAKRSVTGQFCDAAFPRHEVKLMLPEVLVHANVAEFSDQELQKSAIAICVAIGYKTNSGFGFTVQSGIVRPIGFDGVFTNLASFAKNASIPAYILWQPTTYT